MVNECEEGDCENGAKAPEQRVRQKGERKTGRDVARHMLIHDLAEKEKEKVRRIKRE